ncbi:hypothetical protein IE81DRAFT_345196 [Ceraceosorus guamensis]|uniref:Uncharacterized protein n=1 Tax=Ceraceosorus guamensis TaxID=1522189 RepID=A0A316W4Y7_9BASI|nr:hypothetical protein IE81DRAFT_345196 [Ceraceosorus guamensis]PWN44802.1 hypothetical protein IE81DRAFT_345196 [Ceraceosorus guamensis]
MDHANVTPAAALLADQTSARGGLSARKRSLLAIALHILLLVFFLILAIVWAVRSASPSSSSSSSSSSASTSALGQSLGLSANSSFAKHHSFPTRIPIGLLAQAQSALNFLMSIIAALFLGVCGALAVRAATQRAIIKGGTMTGISETLSAWGGLVSAVEAFRSSGDWPGGRSTTLLILLYLGGCSLISALLPAIFTLSAVNTHAPASLSFFPYSNLSMNIDNRPTYTQPAYSVDGILTKDFQTARAGLSGSRIYDILTPSDVTPGTALVKAYDVDVKCGAPERAALNATVAPFDGSFHSIRLNFTIGGSNISDVAAYDTNGINNLDWQLNLVDDVAFVNPSGWAGKYQNQLSRARLLRTQPVPGDDMLNVLNGRNIFMYLLNQEDPDLSFDVGPNYDAKGNGGPRLPFTMYPPPASAPDAAIELNGKQGGYRVNGTITLTGDDGRPTFLNMSATVLGCTVFVEPVSNVSIDMSSNLLLSHSQPARQSRYATREWGSWMPTARNADALYAPDTYAHNLLALTAGSILDVSSAPTGNPATTSRNTAACISRPGGTCHIDTMAESFFAQQLWKARYALFMDENNLPTRNLTEEDLKRKNTLALIEESLANVTAWSYYAISREAFHFASDLHVPVNNSKGFLPIRSTIPNVDAPASNLWELGSSSSSADDLQLPFALSTINAVELQLNAWPIFVGLVGSIAVLCILAYLVRPSRSYERINLIIPGTSFIQLAALLSSSDIPQRLSNSRTLELKELRRLGRFEVHLAGSEGHPGADAGADVAPLSAPAFEKLRPERSDTRPSMRSRQATISSQTRSHASRSQPRRDDRILEAAAAATAAASLA